MKPRRKSDKKSLSRDDLPQFYLLVLLYFVQGVPVGLGFGTIPFLLKSMSKSMSFTSLGLFSIATYPYSLKILWSPIVDSCYSSRIGRRRTWIIPVQFISGALLYSLGWCISHGMLMPNTDSDAGMQVSIMSLVWWFGLLVFLCATQDIAVDGWALTILSKQSLSYASTAQTVGLTLGYFLSFTVFLSLNSSEFINKYFRGPGGEKPYGWITLGGYMKFAGVLYIVLTLYIVVFTREEPLRLHGHMPPQAYSGESFEMVERFGQSGRGDNNNNDDDDDHDHDKLRTPATPSRMLTTTVSLTTPRSGSVPSNIMLKDDEEKTKSIRYIYGCFWQVLRLRPVQTLVLVHLVSKFAFQCNEAGTNLKLLEKGFKREDLAISVLIDVPFEIIFGYYVAKWSTHGRGDTENPLTPKDNSDSDLENGISSPRSASTHGAILRDKQLKNSPLWRRLHHALVGDAGVLSPWLYGYLGRLVAAMLGNYVVSRFPEDGQVTRGYFLLIIFQYLLGSFMGTVQFVGISAFHTNIADPVLGGTYMTLLNTVSNFGGTWPRLLIMTLISNLTIYRCILPGNVDNGNSNVQEVAYVRGDMSLCTKVLGATETSIYRDGYYITNTLSVIIGILLYFFFLKRKAAELQRLPVTAWRCSL